MSLEKKGCISYSTLTIYTQSTAITIRRSNMPNPTILSTEDYSIFKTIKGNRVLSPAHVRNLKEAIDKNNESRKLAPILVNEKYEIIDGQHRLEAIKQLGLSVYYIMHKGLTLKTVQQLHSTAKQWQPMDYAQAFAKLGNGYYQMYIDAKRSPYGLNHDSLLRYLGLEDCVTSTSFKEGNFVVPNFDYSMELLKQLSDFQPYYKRYNIRNFALAFLRLAQEPHYNHKRMMTQFEKYGNKLEERASEVGFFKSLNKIYNYNLSEEKKVIFGTVEYLSRQ